MTIFRSRRNRANYNDPYSLNEVLAKVDEGQNPLDYLNDENQQIFEGLVVADADKRNFGDVLRDLRAGVPPAAVEPVDPEERDITVQVLQDGDYESGDFTDTWAEASPMSRDDSQEPMISSVEAEKAAIREREVRDIVADQLQARHERLAEQMVDDLHPPAGPLIEPVPGMIEPGAPALAPPPIRRGPAGTVHPPELSDGRRVWTIPMPPAVAPAVAPAVEQPLVAPAVAPAVEQPLVAPAVAERTVDDRSNPESRVVADWRIDEEDDDELLVDALQSGPPVEQGDEMGVAAQGGMSPVAQDQIGAMAVEPVAVVPPVASLDGAVPGQALSRFDLLTSILQNPNADPWSAFQASHALRSAAAAREHAKAEAIGDGGLGDLLGAGHSAKKQMLFTKVKMAVNNGKWHQLPDVERQLFLDMAPNMARGEETFATAADGTLKTTRTAGWDLTGMPKNLAGDLYTAEDALAASRMGRPSSRPRPRITGKAAFEYNRGYLEKIPEWRAGRADAMKNIKQLKDVGALLKWSIENPNKSTEEITGAIGSWFPSELQILMGREKSIDAKELVEEVVQRNLRQVLGAQFTENEGKRLIERAWNPRLPMYYNYRRITRLIEAMEETDKLQEGVLAYYEEHGTMLPVYDTETDELVDRFNPEGFAERGLDRPAVRATDDRAEIPSAYASYLEGVLEEANIEYANDQIVQARAFDQIAKGTVTALEAWVALGEFPGVQIAIEEHFFEGNRPGVSSIGERTWKQRRN
jgi:hypothetical protein